MTLTDLTIFNRALEQTEGYCELHMWEKAWGVLDDLPDELRAYGEVLSLRLDVLMGLRHWLKAQILCESLIKNIPDRPDVWFRLACIRAQSGETQAATNAVERCVDLDRTWRLRILDEPLLMDIW